MTDEEIRLIKQSCEGRRFQETNPNAFSELVRVFHHSGLEQLDISDLRISPQVFGEFFCPTGKHIYHIYIIHRCDTRIDKGCPICFTYEHTTRLIETRLSGVSFQKIIHESLFHCELCGRYNWSNNNENTLYNKICECHKYSNTVAKNNDFQSFADEFPEIAKEYEEADNIIPAEKISVEKSIDNRILVNWKCKSCGCIYSATLKERIFAGKRSCAICNPLMQLHEDQPNLKNNIDWPINKKNYTKITMRKSTEVDWSVSEEWSPNNSRKSGSYKNNSHKIVQWICTVCHREYAATIYSRNHNDKLCPYCYPSDKTFPYVNPQGNQNMKLILVLKSLLETNKNLCAEWSKNNPLGPENFVKSSVEQVLWICPACHGEYKSPINKREVNDGSCPYCSANKSKAINNASHKTTQHSQDKLSIEIRTDMERYLRSPNRDVGFSFNSLIDTHEELCKEWSDSNQFGPENYLKSSEDDVLWICPTCHGEYSSSIYLRSVNDNLCPYCNNYKPLFGLNSLRDTHEELCKEWSYSNQLGPENYQKSSEDDVLWICPICHGEYESPIRFRELNDSYCPYCRGLKVLSGFNSLPDTHEELFKEWSSNNPFGPELLMKSSYEKALWICPTCHGEYEARIKDRELNDSYCPYCRGLKVLPGFNSLKIMHNELISEWDQTNNYLLFDPDQIGEKNNEKTWWVCKECGYQYKMSPQLRIYMEKRKKITCPFCNGYRQMKCHFL